MQEFSAEDRRDASAESALNPLRALMAAAGTEAEPIVEPLVRPVGQTRLGDKAAARDPKAWIRSWRHRRAHALSDRATVRHHEGSTRVQELVGHGARARERRKDGI